MTEHVIITGAGGFLGSHVLDVVLNYTDWDVTCVSSFRNNGTVDRITDVLSDGLASECHRINVETHDLRAPLSRRQVAALGDVDYVFDVASRCSVDESLRDPGGFITNNVAVTLTTLDLARLLDVRRYVHVSTDEVYGTNESCSTTDHRPSSPYAASKAAQEDICLAYASSYDVPLTIVNSANMFGQRQSQLAFIPRVVRLALTEQPVPVHVYDGEPGWRHYSHVSDVARRLVDTVGDDVARVVLPGRYRLDNLEVVRAIGDVLGHTITTHLVEATSVRPGADRYYEDLADDLTWRNDDAPSLTRRLTETIEWFVAHPQWLE